MEYTQEPVVHEKRKKVLHFSDGVEELTDSDNVDTPEGPAPMEELIDESKMEWIPWLALKSRRTGETILSGCDYVGEFLASALGITTPKFIDGEEELRKAAAEQKERDEEAAEEIREMDTWKVDTQSTTTTITEPLSPSPTILLEMEKDDKSSLPRY